MMHLNLQPPDPIVQEQWDLDVVEVFPTIQGEGPFAGERAVFLRLAGCNMQCPECDTDYTTNRRRMSFDAIWQLIRRAYKSFNQFYLGKLVPERVLLVITGGEPFRQDIGPFLSYLHYTRMREGLSKLDVQIETNGTIYRSNFPWPQPTLSVVCSPKGGSVARTLWPLITAYKYVIEAGNVDPSDGLPASHLGNGIRVARPHPNFNGVVYIQPLMPRLQPPQEEDSRYLDNLQECVRICMKFGYRLSVQLHKLTGISLP